MSKKIFGGGKKKAAPVEQGPVIKPLDTVTQTARDARRRSMTRGDITSPPTLLSDKLGA